MEHSINTFHAQPQKNPHDKSIKEQDRQLNAPYTCRIKDKILETGKRIKFYKKKKKKEWKEEGEKFMHRKTDVLEYDF